MKYDIFISYRRDGGDTLAQLIYDRLTARGYRVFLMSNPCAQASSMKNSSL